jgi:cytochrome c556
MKSLKLITLYGIAFFGLIAAPFGQPKLRVTTKEFMREKLEHSQKVLGALATEDYFILEKISERLSAMTQEATWQAFQNPDYTQFSANFRTHANALTKAARERNIDAATLAYVRMTMSCVDCHKSVRGRLTAELSPEFRAVQVDLR